jgi:hypothetical protein
VGVRFLAHHEILLQRKIRRGRGIADMAGPAVGSTQSRLTQLSHSAVRFFPEKMGYQRLCFPYRKAEVPSENAT